MRVSVRRVRFFVAMMMALILVWSLSIVLSGTASATTGQNSSSPQHDDVCDDQQQGDVQALGAGHDDCEEPECPEGAVQALGAGHDDCEEPECPEGAVQALGAGHDDCEEPECPEGAVQALGAGHDDCEEPDCDEEDPKDDDCVAGTSSTTTSSTTTSSTTTTSTTAPPGIAPPLDIAAVGAECFNDIPYLSYDIAYPGGGSATITFLNPNGADVVYTDQPLNGAVLWPGANANPPDWPGWILREDGVWEEGDDGYLWARGTVEVLFEVNPSVVVPVSYLQSSAICADPENVQGVVITPPVDQVGGVEVLPFTGVDTGAMAAIALAAIGLGGLLLVSARRDEADET